MLGGGGFTSPGGVSGGGPVNPNDLFAAGDNIRFIAFPPPPTRLRIDAYPSGSTGDIQFNEPSPSGPVFAATNNLRWDNTLHRLEVQGQIFLNGVQLNHAFLEADNIEEGHNIDIDRLPGPEAKIRINAVPSGQDGEIQFNDDDEFGATNRLKWDNALHRLEVDGQIFLNGTQLDHTFLQANRVTEGENIEITHLAGPLPGIRISAVPSGADQWVQFNDNGEFGADQVLRWTGTELIIDSQDEGRALQLSSDSGSTVFFNLGSTFPAFYPGFGPGSIVFQRIENGQAYMGFNTADDSVSLGIGLPDSGDSADDALMTLNFMTIPRTVTVRGEFEIEGVTSAPNQVTDRINFINRFVPALIARIEVGTSDTLDSGYITFNTMHAGSLLALLRLDQHIRMDLPTSPAGLPPLALWRSGGEVHIV